MKVLVTGGRTYTQRVYYRLVAGCLDDWHARNPISLLVCGLAKGVDTHAFEWGERTGIDCVGFPANWNGRGLKAGGYRNRLMHDTILPDVVIAFPGGTGTTNMMKHAFSCGTEVIDYGEWPEDLKAVKLLP